MENRFQHIIPESYLKRWATPSPPAGRLGQIWVHQKSDPRNGRLQSPRTCFGKDEHYTIQTSGERDLGVESALARVESEFGQVMVRIERGNPLRPKDKIHLSFFVASMLARVEPFTGAVEGPLQTVLGQARTIEEQDDLGTQLSDELIESFTGNAGKTASAMTLGNQKMLARMHLTILPVNDTLGLITSDAPACLSTPPGSGLTYLGNEQVECTLPLSPRHLAMYTWFPRRVRSDLSSGQLADEINRRTVQDCHKDFVSWKGEVRDEWLESHALLNPGESD